MASDIGVLQLARRRRSFHNRLLRLTLLAPDIVEAILDGRARLCRRWRGGFTRRWISKLIDLG